MRRYTEHKDRQLDINQTEHIKTHLLLRDIDFLSSWGPHIREPLVCKKGCHHSGLSFIYMLNISRK